MVRKYSGWTHWARRGFLPVSGIGDKNIGESAPGKLAIRPHVRHSPDLNGQDLEGDGLARRQRTFAILLVKIAMAIIGACELSLDEEVANLSLNFKRIAGCHNNVCKLSRLDRTDLVGKPENLGGIQHYGF